MLTSTLKFFKSYDIRLVTHEENFFHWANVVYFHLVKTQEPGRLDISLILMILALSLNKLNCRLVNLGRLLQLVLDHEAISDKPRLLCCC